MEVNPDVTKFVLSLSPEEQKEYHVEPGWLLLPCSGQVYGNLGHAVLATEYHVGKVLTNHILRIAPNDRIRGGYLQCVRGHPELGRPRVVKFAFGSSVPEIPAIDVLTTVIPRFNKATEDLLADLMEASAVARDTADAMEQSLGDSAEKLIDQFLAGEQEPFIRDGASVSLRSVPPSPSKRGGARRQRAPSSIAELGEEPDELTYEQVERINAAFAPRAGVSVKSAL